MPKNEEVPNYLGGKRSDTEKLGAKISEKVARLNELSSKLNRTLAIIAVWPDAFKDEQSCVLKYTTKFQSSTKLGNGERIYSAFLLRDDGASYVLTREQLIYLNEAPEHIHVNFVCQEVEDGQAIRETKD